MHCLEKGNSSKTGKFTICLKEPERFAYGNIEDMDKNSAERIKEQIKKEENEREELSNNLKMYATYLIEN